MNSYNISYTTKTSSIILLALLLLSPLVAIVAITPVAHATSTAGTISLDSSSGNPYWVPKESATYEADGNPYTFGTFVTTTGTGFPSGQSGIDICYVSTTKTADAQCINGIKLSATGSMGGPALLDQTIAGAGNTVTADANGYFQVQFYVPDVAGGTYNVYAVYTPSGGSPVMTTPVVYTVNTSLLVLRDGVGSTNARYSKGLDIIVLGFASGETLQLIPSTWFGGSPVGATGTALGVDQGILETDLGTVYNTPATVINTVANIYGSAGTAAPSTFKVPSAIGGTNYLTALGLISGDSAKATFTVRSSIETLAYASGVCSTTITTDIILDTSPTPGVICIAGFGFAASTTIATANSITVGGVATHHGSITTATDGSFAATPVQAISVIPMGLANVVLGGTTFSWQNANIQPGSHELIASVASATGGSVSIYDASNGYGQSSGYVDDYIYLVGTGFADSATCAGPFDFGTTAVTETESCTALGAGSGAFFDYFLVPTVPYVATGYTIKDTSTHSFPNTFEVLPSVYFSSGAATSYYAFGFAPEIIGSGFKAGETLTAIITQSGATYQTGLTVQTDGTFDTTLNAIGASPTPDLPTGTFDLNVTGSTSGNWAVTWNDGFVLPIQTYSVLGNSQGFTTTAAGSITSVVDTNAAWTPGFLVGLTVTMTTGADAGQTEPITANTATTLTTAAFTEATGSGNTFVINGYSNGLGSALSVNSGNGGQTVALVTSTTSGLHGLAANTKYSIMWDTTTQVGTFTSTANGQVPIGTSFVVPAGTSGLHIVDIQSDGVSAIYASSFTGAWQFGSVSGAGTTVNPYVYHDLIFDLLTSLTVTPTLVGAGNTATIVGGGLPASTQLYVIDPSTSVAYVSFMSTSGGTVPSSVTFTVPQFPAPDVSGGELGTPVTWHIVNALGITVGDVSFIYHTTLALSSTAGPAGSTITVTANGLKSDGTVYNVIFNCIPGMFVPSTCSGAGSGSAPANLVVGALVANSLGYASGPITIPAGAAAGSYEIGVTVSSNGAGAHPTTIGTQVLAIPPIFTIGAPSGVGTTTLTPSGSAAESLVNGQATVAQTFTNTASGPLSVYMWVSVMNTAGQTVGVFLGSATIGAGSSASIGAALFNLPSGTYTAQVFVTTTSGIVVSTTSTTSTFSV